MYYRNRIYEQEQALLEAEKAFTEETLRRSRDYQAYSENLNRKGYTTKTQLEEDQFAVVKAKKEVDLATQKLGWFEKFTRDRTIFEFEAELNKQIANLEAAQFTLELRSPGF